jgi:hypothetical protein
MHREAEESPANFYKYRSLTDDCCKFVERIVCGHEIYFAPPSSFNDPFDCRAPFLFDASKEEMVRDYIRLAKKFQPYIPLERIEADARGMIDDPTRSPLSPAVQAAIQNEHARVITSTVGVFCVSEVRNNILTWSHYADNHRGICLQFDGSGPLMAHAQKVLYSNERLAVNPYRDEKIVSMEKALLTKSDQWSYEREWRLISYQRGPGPVQFRPQNLTGIILGALITPDKEELMRGWVRASASPITLYRAHLDARLYAVNIEKISAE